MTVQELLGFKSKPISNMKLTCIGGSQGLSNEIPDVSINRPGLALAGYYEQFDAGKVHVFGRGETGYLFMLEKKNNWKSINELFKMGIPCSLFTNNLDPPKYFKELAEKHNCPILQSPLSSAEILIRFTRTISAHTSPSKILHGVCLEVYGIGILIIGESGVGKSESALALIERGHRLIADDAVKMQIGSGSVLVASSAKKEFGYHMEIRGIGIINIEALFGISATRERKVIELVINLVQWDEEENYDRLGLNDHTTNILGIDLHTLVIPIKPGRSIPIIIETAAKNERLKQMGHNSAQNFSRNLNRYIQNSTL